MRLRRLTDGQTIAAISSALLLVLTFCDWFGVESTSESLRVFSVGRNAWEALDYIPIVLLAAITAALTSEVLRLMSTQRRAAVWINAVVALLGAVATLLILFRIVSPPDFGALATSFGIVKYEGTVQLPIFLALLAAAGISYGGYRALREGVSFTDLPAGRNRG